MTLTLASAAVTTGAAWMTHKAIVGSGVQPATMCAEYKAAEITNMMAKPLQSNEEKTLMLNPIFSTRIMDDSGRPATQYKP